MNNQDTNTRNERREKLLRCGIICGLGYILLGGLGLAVGLLISIKILH